MGESSTKHASGKGWHPEYREGSLVHQDKPGENQTKDLNTPFPKGDRRVASKHMKRCSPSIIIREMQLKTTPDTTWPPQGSCREK